MRKTQRRANDGPQVPTCFIVWLLGHLSVAHIVPGSLVDNPAPHERTRVPLQLKLLVKKSVCSAVGGGGGNGGAGKLGAVPDDEDCSSSGRRGVHLCRSDQVDKFTLLVARRRVVEANTG